MEQLLPRGPEMFMAPDDELPERTDTFARRVEEVTAKDLPREQDQSLCGTLSRRVHVFRRVLRGGALHRWNT